MSSASAILAGAALIAASVIFATGTHTASAMGNGPYQLMHHSNTNANAGVFRLDTATGEVSYCFLTESAEVICSHAAK
jgi:hypothetical protein